jgi:hypothetical protein
MAYKDWEKDLCGRNSTRVVSIHTWSAHAALRGAGRRRRNASMGTTRTSAHRPSRGWATTRPATGVWVLQHRMNALHITARLVRWGVPQPWARVAVRCWEHVCRWLRAPEP